MENEVTKVVIDGILADIIIGASILAMLFIITFVLYVISGYIIFKFFPNTRLLNNYIELVYTKFNKDSEQLGKYEIIHKIWFFKKCIWTYGIEKSFEGNNYTIIGRNNGTVAFEIYKYIINLPRKVRKRKKIKFWQNIFDNTFVKVDGKTTKIEVCYDKNDIEKISSNIINTINNESQPKERSFTLKIHKIK